MENKLPSLSKVLLDVDLYCCKAQIPNIKLKPIWWENEIAKIGLVIDLPIFAASVPNAFTRMFTQGDRHRLPKDIQDKILDLAAILNELVKELEQQDIELRNLISGTGVKLKY